jgi:hypothetical protein
LAAPAGPLLAAVAPLLVPAPFLDPAPPFLDPAPPFLAAAPSFLAPPVLDAVAVAPRLPDAPVAVTWSARLDCAPDWPDRRVDGCPPPCLACALAAWRPFAEPRDPLMRA